MGVEKQVAIFFLFQFLPEMGSPIFLFQRKIKVFSAA